MDNNLIKLFGSDEYQKFIIMNDKKFSQVFKFNDIGGKANILEPTKNNFIQGFSLIKEEWSEILKAIKEKNLEEIIDGLADLLYVIYGYLCIYKKEYNKVISRSTCKSYNHFRPICVINTFFGDQGLEDLINVTTDMNYLNKTIEKIFELVILCIYDIAEYLDTDLDQVFDCVHNANMTKFCNDLEIAINTVLYYKDHPELGYLEPFHYFDSNYSLWVVKNRTTGKILKSVEWKQENNLSRFCKLDNNEISKRLEDLYIYCKNDFGL